MNKLLEATDHAIGYLFGDPMWILFFVPVLLTIAVMVSRFRIIPNKLQTLIEMVHEFLEAQFKPLFKHAPDYSKWMPFFLAIFFYILTLNMMGIIPGVHPLTSDIVLTASMALFIFAISTFIGIKRNGPIRYLVLLTPGGIPAVMRVIMFPVELISLLSKPFSLAVRLYANMFAGHTVIRTILGLTETFKSAFVVPLDLVAVSILLAFEVFVALIQAFIFAYLSAIYITDNLYLSEHH
ncbi:MAG: F0F1 ATP synthase subunit A [Candidatus Margulisiibacteriota bacterium]